MVYSNNTANPVYMTHTGGSWNTGNVFGTPPGSGTVEWVELVRRPGTNEISLVYADSNSDLFAVVWDGSNWDVSNAATLEQNLSTVTTKAFDAAYEGLTGNLLVVWGLSNDLEYSSKAAGLNGFSAGASVGGGFTGRKGNTVDLASERSGNRIALGTRGGIASDDDFNTAMWNGGSWINITAPSDGTGVNPGSGDAGVAVGWVGTSGVAVAVYSSTSGQIDWSRWSAGGGWVVQADEAVAGMGDTESVLMETFSDQNKLMAVLSDSNSDLYAVTYDGSNWVVTNGGVALETGLSATDSVPYGFSIRRKRKADHMLVTAIDGTAMVAGTEVLSLQLVDQYGNPISGALAVTVTVTGSATFTANDVGGTNGSNSLNGTLSASGTGSVTITNNVAETVTVMTDATGDAEVVANVNDTVAFGAGAADHMLVTATDGTATAGGTEVLSLQLVDQYGNPVSSAVAVNVTVTGSATFSANDVGGVNGSNALSGTLSAAGAGSITITNTLTETVTVSADATGDAEVVANVDDSVIFGAAGADHMLVTATDGTATAGGTEVFSLQLVDQYGNPVSSGLAVNVTVTGSATFSANDVGGVNGSNALSGTLSGTGAGSVTVTNIVAETVTVSADATGDAEVVGNVDDNVIFNPGTATQLAFSVEPSNTATTVQISPAIKVQVQDASGNLVTSATDTITLAIGTNPAGGTLSGTLSRAAVAGEATFNDISIDKVGVGYTLNATSGVLSVAGSIAFEILSGPATQLVFTTQPITAAVGGIIPGTPSVAVQDAGGNTVVGDNSTQITIAIKPGTGTNGATLSGTLTLVVASGVADFTNLSIDLTGSNYILTGSATGLTAGDSSTFNVNSILNLTHSDSPDPVQAGGQITYTLTYSNTSGTETAPGSTIVDTLPANTIFISASDGGVGAGGVVTWGLGNLGPGAGGTRTLVVQVDSPLTDGTVLLNSATLANNLGDSVVAAQNTTVQSAPVLSLSQSDSPDPVVAGSQVTYTLNYSNASGANETALAATITDTLPSNTTFVSASDGGLEASGVVTWTLGNLTPGASGIRTLVIQVNSPMANGTLLTNSATIQDSQSHSAAANQTTTVQSSSVLSVSMSDSPDPVQAGSQITYTINFSNSSAANQTATGVVLADTLPSNATFVSASDGGTLDNTGTMVTWSLGNLTPGSSGIRTLVVQVNSPLVDGTVLNNAITLQDDLGNNSPSSESTTVQSDSVLSLSVSDSPDPVAPGEEVTYTISYGNSSSANETALGTSLTHTLPLNVTFVSASDGGTLDNTGTMVTWTLGDLAPGVSGNRSLVLEVDSPLGNGTLLDNGTNFQDTQGDSASANQSTVVMSAPVLTLTQTFDHTQILSGEQVTITFSYSNSSDAGDTASGLTLTDTLPANTTFVSASDGGLVDSAGTIVTWALSNLAPGGSGTRTLVIELASAATNGSQLTNSAVLQDTQGHSSSSNENTVVGGTTTVGGGGGGGGVIVSSSTSSVVLPAPAPAKSATPLSQSFARRGNVEFPGAIETAQTRGNEVSRGTGERTPQSDEQETREVYESETVITTGDGGVDQITITGNRVEVTQRVASAPSGSSKTQQQNVTSNEKEPRKAAGGIGGVCQSVVSLQGTYDPKPVLVGARVTFTFDFVNTSEDETVQDLTLRNVLPEGMSFISATNDGIEFGNVVTWSLGGLEPGEQGTRSLVAQANFADTGAAFLTNNNVSIEDPAGRCTRIYQSINVQPVSLGDEDNDKFPNDDEIRCGSDPKDPASTCYSLELLEEDKVVEQGSELTFTVLLRRNFNFEGEVNFDSPNSIPGVLWTFSRLSAVLTRTDGMVSFPFTIQTTSTTPLGQHTIVIQAISGGMVVEKTLILEIVPSRKSDLPTDGLTPVSPS